MKLTLRLGDATAAVAIFGAAALAVLLANASTGDALLSLLDDIHLFGMSIRETVASGALLIFFVMAGAELKHEFTAGILADRRTSVIVIAAASCGMLLPAALYLLLAPVASRGFWGTAIATDLPVALAVLAVASRGRLGRVRTLLLALAVVDDVLSVIVLSVAFPHPVKPWFVLATALCLVLIWQLNKRGHSGLPVGALATLSWCLMLQSGFHAPVLGVVIGVLLSPKRQQTLESLQRIADFFAVPLFVFVSVAIAVPRIEFSPGLVGALLTARLVGKPVGVLLGYLGVRLAGPKGMVVGAGEILTVGVLASVGFSVSLLFAQEAAATVSDLAVGYVAIATVLVAAVIAASAATAAAARRL